jgi:hypothetical protein
MNLKLSFFNFKKQLPTSDSFEKLPNDSLFKQVLHEWANFLFHPS